MSSAPSDADNADDLAQVRQIDFAHQKLGYEDFRQLSQNKHLTPEEKIAFPVSYRRGYEDAILRDITRKLENLRESGRTVVDIGSGAGALTERLIALCAEREHHLTMVDSQEMLDLTPTGPNVHKIPGMYPRNAAAVSAAAGPGADAVVCYSVLHYAFVDTNLFGFLDAVMALLRPGGAALFGDIPNLSKRRRFFSSPTGIAFHKSFMNTDAPPVVRHLCVEPDTIDDAVIAGLMARAQAAGCDAYLLPQARDLPMANRRDDLLIQKP
jgi:2-polyprenyl-3-methyl-5-hydroxy-6-metoxy-1,4-benzoquinol methylase